MDVRKLEWVLRLAVFGEFLGHGVFAVQGKAQWIGWIEEILGVDPSAAATLLMIVGVVDIAVAFAVLLWRRLPPVILLWAAAWGLWTALVRPIVGEPVWDFVERSANWGAPLALLLAYGWPKKAADWLRS
ncbi:hypothetical protein A2856_02610 [Candidatus Uhrbacteria bacterium RIFCSPHIGHO2_01_FULL_63_20]|uniref:DoxX family protein n=1 Tax=Candidatus Uhrbacteria bacterium RIFCSPHIGHO2_01_FULL_63_20 TaxID=1802385 RepID=A0A1F7TKN8_9BACT|nr:MAG: hypothetical protein A2856_02610 [Candidatus Uhrbacteria bacterium RIFCSPHIGHO2_01_FULL_63_20]